MLNLLHEAHFGVTKTKERAKTLFYWPNMDNDIENLVGKCNICEKYRSANIKEEMICHEIPILPFQKIGCDILDYGGNPHLVLVDYYSKWLELVELKNKQGSTIIVALKKIFATHGIPEYMIADNMPFNSLEFHQFSREWGFEIKTSSPYMPQSNGQAEKGVGICKMMLRKVSGSEMEIALLEYRNTPVAGLKYTPAEILFGRKTRTKIPISNELLKPFTTINIRDQLVRNSLKNKNYYDRTSKLNRVDFVPGDNVVYRKGKTWEKARIVQQHTSPRSFLIHNEQDNIIRRNQFHLRKSQNSPVFYKDQYEQFLNDRFDNFATKPDNRFNKSPEAPSSTSNTPVTNTALKQQPVNSHITRSGRSSVKPNRYGY